MSEPIHIVFSADRRVLPGLHVAAYSVVANHQDSDSLVHVHVFSNGLTPADVALLDETLRGAGRKYLLETHSITTSLFSRFPSFGDSFGTYFRLLAPEMVNAERFIYLDVDILCCLDVADFLAVDLGNNSAGFLAESKIETSRDRSVANRLPRALSAPI